MNKITQFLDSQESPIRTIFVSSYIPRKCGLATFTEDLTKSLNDLNPDSSAEIIAVNDREDILYPWEVKYKIYRDELDSYYRAAEYVNQSSAQVVCLQHEFGLFGGEFGEDIFAFLRNVNKPVVITFHTILANPDSARRSILRRLSDLSKGVVAMIPDAKDRLERDYDIERNKVAVIHHGVSGLTGTSGLSKKRLKLEDKQILLSSGLINKNKGVENVIKAMPQIVKNFPNAIYCVVGQTHPEVLKQEGEKYRQELISLTRQLKVNQNVKFINKFLPQSELLLYYEACDIFISPHTDKEQITSGTLACALGVGKACISTKYPYAMEMLSQGRGVLVDFNQPAQIESAVIQILGSNKVKSELEQNAYSLGRKMRWPRVAERYLNFFRYVCSDSTKNQ